MYKMKQLCILQNMWKITFSALKPLKNNGFFKPPRRPTFLDSKLSERPYLCVIERITDPYRCVIQSFTKSIPQLPILGFFYIQVALDISEYESGEKHCTGTEASYLLSKYGFLWSLLFNFQRICCLWGISCQSCFAICVSTWAILGIEFTIL